MKQIISKIFQFLKSLFLKLSVIVTLRLGKDKETEKVGSDEEDPESEDLL